MRKPEYLSPTALMTWERDREEYYLKYLSHNKPPSFIQTLPMAVGSAFDAMVKYKLGEALGMNFDLDTLIRKQVEQHNLPEAYEAGAWVLGQYKNPHGKKLLNQLYKSPNTPKMEHTSRQTTADGVPLLGKPDLVFWNTDNIPVIFDWKVTGYYSSSRTYPTKGYIGHKDCFPTEMGGIYVNSTPYLQERKPDWAVQLCTYAWVEGIPVGEPFIAAIDECCCNQPDLKVGDHRCLITKEFQLSVLARYKELWDIIQSEHIFRELSFEDSKAKCEQLDARAAAYVVNDDNDKWYNKIMGRGT